MQNEVCQKIRALLNIELNVKKQCLWLPCIPSFQRGCVRGIASYLEGQWHLSSREHSIAKRIRKEMSREMEMNKDNLNLYYMFYAMFAQNLDNRNTNIS